MKITKLTIQDYQQFENLELDFTYPADHPKAGQPLEKVCFIGKNGVGKTTIMEVLIEYFNSKQLEILQYEGELENRKSRNIFSLLNLPELINPSPNIKFEVDSKRYNSTNNPLYYFPDDKFQYNNKKYISSKNNSPFYFPNQTLKISNFEVKVISDKDKNNFNLIDISRKLTQQLYKENIEYDRGFRDKPKDYLLDLFTWFDKKIPNLNFRLASFDFDTNQIEFVIKDNFNIRITLDDLSSGTRQLMYKLLPLYFEKDNLNDTFLFIDQPEDALFPDLQKQIIDIYTGLGQNNQYFFATHSPLIAMSFEPSEIFALDFDSNNKVILKQRPSGSIGWSADKLLYHWFGTSSESNAYFELKEQFYNLLNKETKAEEDIQKLVELRENPILSELFN